MRSHPRTTAVLTAGLAIAMAAGAAVTTTAWPAAAMTAIMAVAAAPARQAGPAVFLVTGDLIVAGAAGPAGVSIAAGGRGDEPAIARCPARLRRSVSAGSVIPSEAEPVDVYPGVRRWRATSLTRMTVPA
jgi:hypothetical protein